MNYTHRALREPLNGGDILQIAKPAEIPAEDRNRRGHLEISVRMD